MQHPLVSIITPCYNSGKFIHRLLDSVLNQTYRHLELICVDDGSIDDTREIIFSYEERFKKSGMVLRYLHQENKGQAAALNAGLKQVNGEFLTWPDSDDFLAETSIEKKVAFLEENPSYALVRSNGMRLDDKTLQPIKRVSNNPNRFDQYIFKSLFLRETFVCCGCYMVRFSAFLEIYPDRTIFESRYGQNFQMLLPLASVSPCGFIDEDLYFILERENSHSRENRDYIQDLQRIDGIEEILKDVFRHSNCNFKDCLEQATLLHAKKRLVILAMHDDWGETKEQRKLLFQAGGFSNWAMGFYYSNKYTYRMIKSLKSLLKLTKRNNSSLY